VRPLPLVAAIVVAGGSGERLGREGGKQLAVVAGLPVLSWTLKALAEQPEIDLIVVVTHPERVVDYREVAIDPLGLSTGVVFAAGGESRQASVAAGLAAVPDSVEVVIVQDGARPLLTSALVGKSLAALRADPGAAGVVVGHCAVDTLKIVEGAAVVSTPDRSRFWAVQTPQVFWAAALRQAYARASAEGFLGTDDSSLVERDGGRVVLVEGPRDNIKVTVPEDIVLVEAVLRSRQDGGAQ
jgi:2-C-methyl-D-erythritol 4-phosphate cytidylyltransferase